MVQVSVKVPEEREGDWSVNSRCYCVSGEDVSGENRVEVTPSPNHLLILLITPSLPSTSFFPFLISRMICDLCHTSNIQYASSKHNINSMYMYLYMCVCVCMY